MKSPEPGTGTERGDKKGGETGLVNLIGETEHTSHNPRKTQATHTKTYRTWELAWH